MNIANIRSALKTVMQSLVTSQDVAVVYDYYEPQVSGYPAIIFDITDNADAFLTNQENLARITFTAYIMVDIKVSTLDGAKDLLDNVTDALIAELRDQVNMSLSGNADWISPVVGPRSQIETPNGQALAQQLNIAVNVSSLV